MKKILKYGLFALVIVLVLVVGVISYVLATFNPNEYKPQIIQTVKDKQNRTLKLDGDITLTLFPSIGAKINKISLSELNSEKEFAAIADAHVSLALLPLLSKKVVVNEVGLSGVNVEVVKYKNGQTNLDDFFVKPEAKEEVKSDDAPKSASAVKFDIAGVSIAHTNLTYRDESTATQYSLKELNLKTGRVANGVPTKINFDAAIEANKPQLNVATQIQTTLTFDLEKKLFKIEGLDLQVIGTAVDISNLQIKASGDASANLLTNEFQAQNLAISVTGVKAKDTLAVSLNMPGFTFTKEKVAVEKLLLNANLDGSIGKVVAMFSLQDMQGNAKSFKSSGIALNVDFKQAEQAFKLNLSTPLVGSLDEKQINFSNLVLALNATGDKLPGKSVSSEMKGSVQLDGERESVQLNLAGGLLQSQIKAKLALKGFSIPAIRYDVEIDQFDADLYLPKKPAPEANAKADPVPEQPFDLSALQKLNLEGSLRVGSLKVANVKSSKLRIDVKASKGLITVNPLMANLYQGSINGNVSVDVTKPMPIFVLKENLSGVQLGPLVKDAASFDMIEGKGNVVVNLSTNGNLVSLLKKNLSGNVGLNMAGGAIKGVNLTKIVSGAQNLGQAGSMQSLKPNSEDKTEFSELKANFNVNNGVAHNDDLILKSQSLRVVGSGDVDIGNSSINYSTKTTLAESVDTKNGSITLPVQLIGPFSDLKINVDYGAIIKDIAKQKIETKKEQLKDELQEKLKSGLKDSLKGLFK
jgi:AsmA protein